MEEKLNQYKRSPIESNKQEPPRGAVKGMVRRRRGAERLSVLDAPGREGQAWLAYHEGRTMSARNSASFSDHSSKRLLGARKTGTPYSFNSMVHPDQGGRRPFE